MKLTVLHIVQHLRPGGIESLVLEMQRSSKDCHIVSLEGDRETALKHWPRLEKHADRLHFLSKPEGVSVRVVSRLFRLIGKIRPDIVHTHHVGPLLYGGLAARLHPRCGFVHTEHDAWHLENQKRSVMVKAAVGLLKPELVSDAEVVAQKVSDAIGCKSEVVRNGIDVHFFKELGKAGAREQFGLPNDVPVIGTAGRLEPVKNHALLIKTLKQLSETPSAVLAIAGDGSLRTRLEQLAEENGLRNRVYFVGHVSDMPTFYSALDVFVLPSDKEGYPLSLLEAQACDTVVVATDTGGSSEAVCRETGRIVPVGDQDALAATIASVLNGSRTSSPRKFVEDHGSLDAMMAGYRRVYQRATA